mgnify:CR=1 FL=1
MTDRTSKQSPDITSREDAVEPLARQFGEEILLDYVTGTLDDATRLMVAAQMALRPEISETLAIAGDLAGLMLEEAEPVPMGEGAFADVMAAIDALPDAERSKAREAFTRLMAFDGKHALSILDKIGNDNRKGEFYLTDAVAIARKLGLRAVALEVAEDEVSGINTKAQLAEAEAVTQRRLRLAAMEAGVTLVAPDTVQLCTDTKFGKDVTVEPYVVFGPGVTVADGATIRSFSHLQGAEVGRNAIVGPYARLRPGARLEADVHIGNFVEVKEALIEQGAKANHLTYIGDARVGAGSNIGAGTITCNYDGEAKHRTDIGKGAFVGSNSSLVAPVTIGDGAYIGSGSVITADVPPDSLAIGRGRQTVKEGWAKRLRDLKSLVKKKA